MFICAHTCRPSSMAALRAALKMAFCPQLSADRLCCVSIAARSYLERHSSYLQDHKQAEG